MCLSWYSELFWRKLVQELDWKELLLFIYWVDIQNLPQKLGRVLTSKHYWVALIRICLGNITLHTSRGVARIFQRGGGVTILGSPTIHGLYSCSPSCTSGISRIIVAWRPILIKDKSRWRKYFTKQQIIKKWAFQQWLLLPRYCHGVFATWIL